MTSVNDPDNFAGRVNLAALVISKGRSTSRSFDSCFENNDGDAVATALYRRAQKSPDGDLARNLWRYLSKDSVEPVALANAHRTNLSAWSRELRAAANARWGRQMNPPQMNDCQKAFDLLAKCDEAETEQTAAGPQVIFKRKIAAPGELSDGTRAYVVTMCDRARWLVVTLGWDTIAEIDQRSHFERPATIAAEALAAIDRHAAGYRTELTPAGEQTVIPGCERNLAPGTRQLDLFG